MTKRLLLSQDILPKEGSGTILVLENGQEIALFCLEGQFYAIDNICPHEGGPLGNGELEGAVVTCPWHGWQFDIKTGKGNNSYGEDVTHYQIDQTAEGVFLVLP
jgi:nitrite reductase (NADH) small subunit